MVFMKGWKGDHLPALSISARGAAGSSGKSDWIHSKGTQKSHRHRAFWQFLSRICKELIKAHWHFYNDNINIHKLQHRRIIASQHISTGMQCWCLLQCLCSTIPQPTQVWCPRSEEGRCTEKLSSALASEVPRRASTKCEKNCIFQEGVGAHLSPTFIHLHTSSYRSKSVYCTMVYPVYSSISFSLQTRRFRSPTVRLSENRLLFCIVQLWIPSGWRSGCPPPDVSHHQVLQISSVLKARDQNLGIPGARVSKSHNSI